MTVEAQEELMMDYHFDSSLMYLIQSSTGKESGEILAFFSDLARAVALVGMEKRKSSGAGIHKKISDYYPGTPIPFFLEIKGTNKYSRHATNKQFRCSVEVKFPESTLPFSNSLLQRITEALIERDLLGGNGISLQPFDKPDPKTPRMYKKMMEDICGKQPPRPKKEGYDPDIVGNCRNCGRKPSDSWRPCVCGGPNDPTT